jgi:hypothetical protein
MALKRFPGAEAGASLTLIGHSIHRQPLFEAAARSISMGHKASDNTFAERINWVSKNEYLIPWAPAITERWVSILRPSTSANGREPICRGAQDRGKPFGKHTENFDTIKEHPYCAINLN